MTREEAIEKVRQMSLPKETREILEALIPELRESEDERIRKHLIEIVETYWGTTNDPGKTADLAYLEKQKDIDKMIVVSPEVWDGAINDAYENGKKDSEKQKEQKPVDLSEMMVHKEPYIAPVPTPMVADEQRPAEWSEEDKRIRKAILGFLNPDKGGTKYSLNAELVEWSDWLKSLPERFNLQPKNEWNEEDEKWINYFYSLLGLACEKDIHGLGQKAIDAKMWLKSLRPQLHWKPSEEQIKAIESCFCEFGEGCPDEDGLRSLYNDLKKLM